MSCNTTKGIEHLDELKKIAGISGCKNQIRRLEIILDAEEAMQVTVEYYRVHEDKKENSK